MAHMIYLTNLVGAFLEKDPNMSARDVHYFCERAGYGDVSYEVVANYVSQHKRFLRRMFEDEVRPEPQPEFVTMRIPKVYIIEDEGAMNYKD